MNKNDERGRMMMPGEVASILRVDPKTVNRWARAGKFREGETFKTPGGHLRIWEYGVRRILNGEE